jgi:maltose alpha-D-glucosyltransferase/alpha-amylase
VPEFETLVVPLGSTWVSLARTRGVFERDVLPAHLARTRWYPERSADAIHPTLTSAIPFCDIGDNRPWLAFFETKPQGETSRYLLPMQIEWVRFDRERYDPHALAAVRQGAREGTLLDVATGQIFIALFQRNLRQSLTVRENGQRLEFKPTSKFPDRAIRQPEHIRVIETERCSMALVDSDYVVRVYRKVEPGIHPEIELGRFLTDVAGFSNAPPLLGSAELVEKETTHAIASVHGYIENQGDGWTVSGAYLDRFVDDQRLLMSDDPPQDSEQQSLYLRYMAQAGRRVAELHAALASRPELADFAAEPIRRDDVRRWTCGLMERANRVCEALQAKRDAIRGSNLALVDRLLSQQRALPDRLRALLPEAGDGLNIRLHGNLDLRQTLVVKDDIYVIGFEGDPRKALSERRRKEPAARDVADFIASIGYSAAIALARSEKMTHDEHGRIASALSRWRDRSAAAFLSAYRETQPNPQLWPADPYAADAMLDFFLLEKFFDKMEYELNYRPEWLQVPLIEILNILSKPAHEA